MLVCLFFTAAPANPSELKCLANVAEFSPITH